MRFCVAATMLAAALAQSSVQVQSWGSNSVRIRISVPGNPVVDPLINGLLDYPPAGYGGSINFTLGIAQNFTNGNIQVSSDASGRLTISRLDDGRVILAQRSLQWAAAPAGTKPGSMSANISFAGVAHGEQIVGFGEQQDGQVVKSLPFSRSIEASEYYPYNHGSQALVPFYLSTAGYAVLFNSPSYGVLYVGNDQVYYYSNATLCLDMWVSTGPAGYTRDSGMAFPPLLSQYADAAGHAPPVPYFATGFLASKDRYRNQSQLLDVARGYVKRGLPLSLITIDWLHWANLGDMMLRPGMSDSRPATRANPHDALVAPEAVTSSLVPYFICRVLAEPAGHGRGASKHGSGAHGDVLALHEQQLHQLPNVLQQRLPCCKSLQ